MMGGQNDDENNNDPSRLRPSRGEFAKTRTFGNVVAAALIGAILVGGVVVAGIPSVADNAGGRGVDRVDSTATRRRLKDATLNPTLDPTLSPTPSPTLNPTLSP